MLLPDNVRSGQTGRLAETKYVYAILRHVRYADDPSYANLQAAIDDTPDHGTLMIPPTVNQFERVVVAKKSITLRGYGFNVGIGTQAGNDPSWSNTAALGGSILRSTAVGGVAIDATSGRVHLENLAIVGADGSATGIQVGSVATPQRALYWRNVQFSNFAVGALLNNVYEGVYEAVAFRSCVKGFHLKGANSSVLIGCGFTTLTTAIHMDGSSTVTVQGGTIQGVTGTGILVDRSEECSIRGVYFENANAQWAIDTVGVSDRLIIQGNHTGTAADHIRINTNHCHVWLGKYGPTSPSLTVTGSYNAIYAPVNRVTINNNGYSNVIHHMGDLGEQVSGSNVIFNGASPVLTSPNGTRYRLTITNDGTLTAVAL